MSELIRLEGVGVTYQTKKVLEDLDLTIRAGEFVAVCGETGCGKSTMLRLILGSTGENCRGRTGIAGMCRRSIRCFRIRLCWTTLRSVRRWKSSDCWEC